MYKIGDTVRVIHNGAIGAIIALETIGTTTKYKVLVNGKALTFFDEQIELFETPSEQLLYTAKDVNALLTSRLILNPNVNSLYSLNSAKIDYIPYQFRPVLKIIKSDSPMEDFLSNLLPEEDERIRCWFYTESELYRYGIKFLVRYKLEDYSARNVYTEMFSLKDLSARGYFMQFMTDLPLEYQWLYLHLQKEIERRQELFKKPKPRKHNRFIKELKAIAKKANTTPMEYFKKTFLPYLESKYSKQTLAFAKKELGFFVIKEDNSTPISEQLEKVIKSLPKKERERLEALKK